MNSINKVQIPFTIDLNVYKAYISDSLLKSNFTKTINTFNLEWEIDQPKTLRLLTLDEMIKNWDSNPNIFNSINNEDKNYLLQNISVTLPIKILSTHIKDNIFWERCFNSKWPFLHPELDDDQQWISIFMEKYLSEYLEQLDPSEYDQEGVQSILDICGIYIENLDINYLQPSAQKGDHIPFDYILSNLPELQNFRLTFNTKNIGTEYYPGCSRPSKIDIINFCRGLQKCYELTEFNLHSVKMESSMLTRIAIALDKGCTNLITLEFPHCRFGDAGLTNFLKTLNKDSFPKLENLNLSNNKLTSEAALILSRTLKKRKLKSLDLAMNPIGSDGAAAIFSIIGGLSLEHLDVSACSITESIARVLFKLIVEMQVVTNLDLSNNVLGDELGKNLYKIIGFNKSLKYFDLRNTAISNEYKNKIYAVIFENREKL